MDLLRSGSPLDFHAERPQDALVLGDAVVCLRELVNGLEAELARNEKGASDDAETDDEDNESEEHKR